MLVHVNVTVRVTVLVLVSVLVHVLVLDRRELSAEVTIPPAPARHFNDYASLVSPADADRLDARLRDLERGGHQVVVAIFPELPSPSLEDFTVRTAQAWGVGDKKLDTGAVLFVFVKDRKSRLEVGYGLEGRIPDALAKRILDDEMTPHFRQGSFAAGLDAAITAIASAIGGQYVPPAAARPYESRGKTNALAIWIVLFAIFLLILRIRRSGFPMVTHSSTYSRSGWYSGSGWSSRGGGGSWSSGGGGFSGGGGSFGGGGASGSW